MLFHPSEHKHLYNICTTSAQRLRRWSNIVQMLYKCFVFTGIEVNFQNNNSKSNDFKTWRIHLTFHDIRPKHFFFFGGGGGCTIKNFGHAQIGSVGYSGTEVFLAGLTNFIKYNYNRNIIKTKFLKIIISIIFIINNYKVTFIENTPHKHLADEGLGGNHSITRGGGLEFFKWTNYLFHFLYAILYLFHTLPQAKYLFHFHRILFSAYKVGS